MNYGFFWTEQSHTRNSLTAKFEPLQPYLLFAFCQNLNATHFFDVGANIGFYSLFISLSPQIKNIYSFEASKETFNALYSNIELNELQDKIACINKAVSSTVGTINFQTESPLSGINSVVNTSFHRASLFTSTKIVDCCTIDSYSQLSNSRIGIKIDVEGHENHVLQGAVKLLTNNECIIQVEIYADKDQGTCDLLSKLGYKKLFKTNSDFYYSNSSQLSDPTAVIDVLESAVGKFIDHNLGKWPIISKPPSVFLNSNINSNGILFAEISYDKNVFKHEVEYAFYINVNGKTVYKQWYQDSPVINYDFAGDITINSISVSGFLRERQNPDKKLMVTVPAKIV